MKGNNILYLKAVPFKINLQLNIVSHERKFIETAHLNYELLWDTIQKKINRYLK